MNLYLDIIWLLNFFIDLLLLLLTSFVLKKSTTKRRLILGALFASMYVWFLFIPAASIMTHPIMKGIYSVIIILITFQFQQFRTFVQALFMFYFVNFAVGGGLIGIHYFFQVDSSFIQGSFATKGYGFGSPISWAFVIFGFPLVYMYSRKNFDAVETATIRYDQTIDVDIFIRNQVIRLKGFIDSGNQLMDPFTKKPVMIIDMTKVAEQFPIELFTLSKQAPESFAQIPDAYVGIISIVPYRTVGHNQQFLWTLKPDKVMVHDQGEVYQCPGTLIGLSQLSLAEKGEYECLLHPAMIQNRRQA